MLGCCCGYGKRFCCCVCCAIAHGWFCAGKQGGARISRMMLRRGSGPCCGEFEIWRGGAMPKRRILMLCPFAPRRDALHGGNQLIGRLVEELSEGNLVRVLCLRSESEPAAEEELARRCDSIEEIRRPGAGRGFRRTWNLLSAFWTGQPLWVQEWSSRVFRKRVRDTILSWRPDVIHFEAHIMAQYLDEAW